MSGTQEVVAEYFQAKQRELQALAELAVCEHSGLKGGHREEIYRSYLSHLLPKRYSVSRGMVYGVVHRSREADIVIWDSHAYPSLPLKDHSFFFAESVRGVIECKSVWSSAEFTDALQKTQALRSIVLFSDPSLADEIVKIQLDIQGLKTGQWPEGFLSAKHRIGTVAMFLKGGGGTAPKDMLKLCEHGVDFSWPDLLVLLEPGLVVRKYYDPETGDGRIMFFRYGPNALMAFSSALLQLLDDRVVHSEARFFMDRYTFPHLDAEPYFTSKFSPVYVSPGRIVL